MLQCSVPSPNNSSKSSAQEFCLFCFQRESGCLEDQDLFIAILGGWSRHAQLAGPTSNDRHIKCYQTAAVRGLVFLMRPYALQSQSVLHNNVAYNVSWLQDLCNENSKADLVLTRVWIDATLDLLGVWLHCPFFFYIIIFVQ